MRLTNKMPGPIEKSIVKQNVLFLHNRNQFSPEYFNFMKKLISCNTGTVDINVFYSISFSCLKFNDFVFNINT